MQPQPQETTQQQQEDEMSANDMDEDESKDEEEDEENINVEEEPKQQEQPPKKKRRPTLQDARHFIANELKKIPGYSTSNKKLDHFIRVSISKIKSNYNNFLNPARSKPTDQLVPVEYEDLCYIAEAIIFEEHLQRDLTKEEWDSIESCNRSGGHQECWHKRLRRQTSQQPEKY